MKLNELNIGNALRNALDDMQIDSATEIQHTAFAKIMINTSPFNNIIFHNVNDDYMLNIIDRRVTQLHFWVTTAEHGVIELNDDFSFTLKVEVYEDDQRRMVDQNSGLGELLRLLLLQNHVHHGDRNLKE